MTKNWLQNKSCIPPTVFSPTHPHHPPVIHNQMLFIPHVRTSSHKHSDSSFLLNAMECADIAISFPMSNESLGDKSAAATPIFTTVPLVKKRNLVRIGT